MLRPASKKALPPKKLSEAILMAITDLEAIEQNPNYKINMHRWHDGATFYFDKNSQSYEVLEQCHVCFSGSVIANTFKAPIGLDIDADHFSGAWEKCFYALDSCRQGEVKGALEEYYPNISKKISDSYAGMADDFYFQYLTYEMNKMEFKNAMIDLAMMLESHGY